MNNLKKIIMLPITLALGLVGCSTGSSKTYVLTTTSFNYDPSYRTYDVLLNEELIGGGGTKRSGVITGPQYVKWGEDASKRKHIAKNIPYLTKEDLKGKSYLAVHLYPDNSVEITLTDSESMPNATQKGLEWRNKLRNEKNNR